jgi:hypothetical protein
LIYWIALNNADINAIFDLFEINSILPRGPRAWRSAGNFEEMEKFFRFVQKEICSVGISASLVVLHCIISQMLSSQPCDGDTEASKNRI